MRCKNAKVLLSASLDGELSLRQQLVLDRHIETCAECARDKAEFAGLRDVMSAWPDENPSEWLAANFSHKLEQFQQEKQASRSRRPRWAFGMVATGAATVLVIAGFMLHAAFFNPAAPVAPNMVAVRPPTTNAVPAHKPVNGAKTVPAPKPVLNKPVTVAKTAAQPIIRNTRAVRITKPVMIADSGLKSNRAGHIGNRTSLTDNKKVNTEQVGEIRVAMTMATDVTAVSKIANHLGEADIAMNESVERVRGTLQRAVDLTASASSTTSSGLNHNGGSTL